MQVYAGYYMAEVARFRNSVMTGLLIKTPKGQARLLRKYPYIAETDIGTFQWSEIFFAERGMRYDI